MGLDPCAELARLISSLPPSTPSSVKQAMLRQVQTLCPSTTMRMSYDARSSTSPTSSTQDYGTCNGGSLPCSGAFVYP